ncbi:MAG: proton-translocating NADH-quinone oxidoreductase, chain [Ilumatobacteraceae bacterium]|nr:proton-translocating NADH-quinone oxidoreductase, chain [Ilumatobacteraceae bacterium]
MLAEVERLSTPSVEWSVMLPVLILLGGAVVLMIVGALTPRRPKLPWHAGLTVVIALGSIVASVFLWWRVRDDGPIAAVSDAVVVDGLSLYLGVAILCSVVLAALLAHGYLRREKLEGPDVYVLMLLSAAGGLVMCGANDLLVLFLGLEILSIAVYVLAGIHVRRARSGEAALKYFVLGAFSSAFFLYGIALVYGATGSTNFTKIQTFLAGNLLTNNVMLLAGFALLLVGLGFKVAAVPFHAWTPDVYEGSPSPVVAYMASGVKVAGFAGMIRVFTYTFSTYEADWQPMIYALAVATLVVGALFAVSQTNVKRMLAYSSISHAGFILIAIQASSTQGTRAALFYLATYTFMVAGSFGVVTVVGRAGDNAHDLSDYSGLARRSPLLAFAFLVFLLAQAGVPFTSGFLAKFGVIGAAVEARSFWLALIAMLSSVISAFVYLRIVLAMYDREAEVTGPRLTVPLGARAAILIALLVTIGVGLVPEPLAHVTRTAVRITEPKPAPQPAPAEISAGS